MKNIYIIICAAFSVIFGMNFASAAVSPSGPVACTGVSPNIICVQELTCTNGDCAATLIDETNATCTYIVDQLEAAQGEPGLGDPLCSWSVVDDDNTPVVFTIDNTDGLPVEVMKFGVE